MKKLLTLVVVGFMMTVLTNGCIAPPAPTFDPPGGTYGYSMDLSDPMNPVPVLQEVQLVPSDPANIIFFSLDQTYPGYWDIQDPDHPNWDNVATFTGSIPYMDLSALDPTAPDLTQLTSVGLVYLASGMTGSPTTTIYALEFSVSNGLDSEVAGATYTLDPTLWAGDYTVVGHPPLNPVDPLTADTTLQMLVGMLSPPPDGAGFTTIDGDLTITNLYTPDPLGLLYGCTPIWAPGCLTEITGDLIVINNPNQTTANIEAMAAAVTVGGSVIHCGNDDDDPCNALTINLCSKTAACADPPEGEWPCDGTNEAIVGYTPDGPTLEVQLSGTAPSAGVDYTLVYYPDPYPGNGLICLASATSDATTREITIPWTSNDIGEDLPIPADEAPLGGAKLMLLPSAVVDCVGQTTTAWSCDALFGASDATDIITYTYTP